MLHEMRPAAVIAAGSHVPSLAVVSGVRTSFDLTSIAELLVFSAITYPFTSHERIVELPPGSANSFAPSPSGIQHSSTVLWQPEERDDPFAPTDLSEELEAAMRVAAREITAGVSSVALTLSGGRDSRAVLAALPADKRNGAITYVSRWNREAEVARRVAESAGLPHHSAMRAPDFYELLMERTVALQGSEQRGQAHGLCIPDSGLHEKFELIIGGQFADTYLKDHFMPPWLRARAAGSGRFRGLRRVLARARSLAVRRPATLAFLQNHKLVSSVRPELAEAVRARHQQRLREVGRIRPVSAAEWIAIWPSSRRYAAASHVQGNSRVFPSDTLYTHRKIVDIAVRVPLKLRINGELANRTFQMLYGPCSAHWKMQTRACPPMLVKSRNRRPHCAGGKKDLLLNSVDCLRRTLRGTTCNRAGQIWRFFSSDLSTGRHYARAYSAHLHSMYWHRC